MDRKAGRVLDAGQRILTPRRFAVVPRSAEWSDWEIALELGLASGTVRWQDVPVQPSGSRSPVSASTPLSVRMLPNIPTDAKLKSLKED